MKKEEKKKVKKQALEILAIANVKLTQEERKKMEITDLSLGEIKTCGLQIVTYINTDRYCAKEIVLLPKQTCPEHKHPPHEEDIGKQETFRCRYGNAYLYVEGSKTPNPKVTPPEGDEKYYTASKEIILKPGMQYTLSPDTKHWFKAGKKGAVISEFSSSSDDASDVFTDPRINRL